MPAASNFVAYGNINTCRFLEGDVTSLHNYGVLEASDATDKIVGISQEGAHDPPGVSGSTAYAAVAGQTLQVFQDGDECLLQIGAGGCTQWDWLLPTTGGKGIPYTAATGTIQVIGAQALEAGLEDEKVRVRVRIFSTTPS